MYRNSDTATLPHPVMQSITTPAPSHFRGDWGLKRPIPKKKLLASTHSNTSVIRVRAQDTWEHITDFESASDHVQTERKWRQIGIPMLIKEPRSTYSGDRGAPQSVYDDKFDNTDRYATAPASDRLNRPLAGIQQGRQRWKYDGPWLPGMDEGEFDEYVSRKLSKRRGEFRQFLTKWMLERRINDEERKQREQGLRPALKVQRIEELRAEIESNYETEEKKLRDKHVVENLSSEMTEVICEFLDLPGIRMNGARSSAKTLGLQSMVADLVSEAGPPSTHPGAGLSHIRTNAYIENHPYWGPQTHRTPVKARVLRPRRNVTGKIFQAELGVAGVVTSDPISAAYEPPLSNNMPGYGEDEKELHYLEADRMTYALDENLPGGNKIWVHPNAASIDENSRIQLEVTRGDKEAIAVRKNEVSRIHEARAASFTGLGYLSRGRDANYGISLPDTREPSRPQRPSMQGFDEELGRTPQQQRMSDEEAGAKIRELMSGRGASSRG